MTLKRPDKTKYSVWCEDWKVSFVRNVPLKGNSVWWPSHWKQLTCGGCTVIVSSLVLSVRQTSVGLSKKFTPVYIGTKNPAHMRQNKAGRTCAHIRTRVQGKGNWPDQFAYYPVVIRYFFSVLICFLGLSICALHQSCKGFSWRVVIMISSGLAVYEYKISNSHFSTPLLCQSL